MSVPSPAAASVGLKECIGKLTPNEDDDSKIVGDLLNPGDFAVLFQLILQHRKDV